MANKVPPRVVKYPTPEETKIIFEEYALAVGKVVHAWNYLQEKLAGLFCEVTDMERNIALAVWYSTENDRTQRMMLLAAISVRAENTWPRHPKAKEDMEWIIHRSNELAERRNDAIHGPCILTVGGDSDVDAVMAASILSDSKRAKNLRGKQLLVEFDWLERYAETLSRFVYRAISALTAENETWPDRPQPPNRRRQKDLLNRPLQAATQ